jgi:hypothetical protein
MYEYDFKTKLSLKDTIIKNVKNPIFLSILNRDYELLDGILRTVKDDMNNLSNDDMFLILSFTIFFDDLKSFKLLFNNLFLSMDILNDSNNKVGNDIDYLVSLYSSVDIMKYLNNIS